MHEVETWRGNFSAILKPWTHEKEKLNMQIGVKISIKIVNFISK